LFAGTFTMTCGRTVVCKYAKITHSLYQRSWTAAYLTLALVSFTLWRACVFADLP